LPQEVEVATDSIGYEFDRISRPENANNYYRLAYSNFVVPLMKAIH